MTAVYFPELETLTAQPSGLASLHVPPALPMEGDVRRKDLAQLSRLETWESLSSESPNKAGLVTLPNITDTSPHGVPESTAIPQELGFCSSFTSLPMSSVSGCESDLLPDLEIEMPRMPPALIVRLPKRPRSKARYKNMGRIRKPRDQLPNSKGSHLRQKTFAEEAVYNFLHRKKGGHVHHPSIRIQDMKEEEEAKREESPIQQVKSPKPLKHSQSRGRLSMASMAAPTSSFVGRESKATARSSEISALLLGDAQDYSATDLTTPSGVRAASIHTNRRSSLPSELGGNTQSRGSSLVSDMRREVALSRNARASLKQASEKLHARFQRLESKRMEKAKLLKIRKRETQKKQAFSEMPESERQALIEAFARFDIDMSGYLDHGEVIACLREFGLCGTTPAEKREILRICCQATTSDEDGSPREQATSPGKVAIDLFDLALTVVPLVRHALVELRGDELFKEFFKYDIDGSGTLSKAEMKELARGMGLDPRSLDLSLALTGSDDEVDFETFQDMIVLGREQLQRVCRDREREVQKIAGLSEAEFQDVREDLVGLHDVFLRYDKDRSGSLNKNELTFMLLECGLAPKNAQEKAEIDKIIEECDRDKNKELSFMEFLNIFRAVRSFRQDTRRAELVERFQKYDRDGSGNLSSNEISLLLSDLGLVPLNRKEQEQLANLISSVDIDGSGFIDFAEFAELSQRIDEKLKSFRYEEEVECAMCLGFSEKQMRDFRWVFDSLDTDGSQKLDAAEVKNGLSIMSKKIGNETFDTIFAKLDADGSGELDFLEFVHFMKMLRDGDGPAFSSDDVQKLTTKAKNLDTRVLRRVLEYFRLAKHYIHSLSHEHLVGLFCEFFKVQPNTNLHDALDVRTIADLYEAAQKRDQAMHGNLS
mmetsp:Transcript_120478/g.190947  ORF Transcript_120478/g.190947 Transcript_120478/m.190947 type:complete len:883 (+) Transcript_120478:87-2735(+)